MTCTLSANCKWVGCNNATEKFFISVDKAVTTLIFNGINVLLNVALTNAVYFSASHASSLRVCLAT